MYMQWRMMIINDISFRYEWFHNDFPAFCICATNNSDADENNANEQMMDDVFIDKNRNAISIFVSARVQISPKVK